MNPEVDKIINLMRQSKMDAVRRFLEEAYRHADKGDEVSQLFINQLRTMFLLCSTPKQT